MITVGASLDPSDGRSRRRVTQWLTGLLLVGFFIVTGRHYVSAVPFGYDEADYVSAARRGFVANYVDAGVIDIETFIQKGVQSGRRPEDRSALSTFIRESGDISFQRHYHGPLYFYWIIAAREAGATTESAARWASWLLLGVAAVLAAMLAKALCQAPSGVAMLVAAVMTLAGSAGGRTAAQITPHAMYVPIALLVLLATVRWMERPDRLRSTLVGVTVGLALVTIEYAALLVASTLVALRFVQQQRQLETGGAKTLWRMLGRLIAVTLATVLVVWPGGLLKLSLAKNYVFFTYFALVRGGEYGHGSVIGVWSARIADTPVEYLLITLGIAYYVTRFRADRRWWPVLSYVGLVLLTTVRNRSPLPTYVASMLPPLYVLCGVAIQQFVGGWSPVRRILAVAGLTGLVLANSYTALPATGGGKRLNSMATMVHYFGARGSETGRILVPSVYVPSLDYYYPTLRVVPYSERTDGLEKTARLALDSAYAGLVYASRAAAGFGPLLPPERIRRVDTIALAPTIPFYAFYYDLRP